MSLCLRVSPEISLGVSQGVLGVLRGVNKPPTVKPPPLSLVEVDWTAWVVAGRHAHSPGGCVLEHWGPKELWRGYAGREGTNVKLRDMNIIVPVTGERETEVVAFGLLLRSRPHLAKPDLAILIWPHLAKLNWPHLANFF